MAPADYQGSGVRHTLPSMALMQHGLNKLVALFADWLQKSAFATPPWHISCCKYFSG
jgi:hypothetical protein